MLLKDRQIAPSAQRRLELGLMFAHTCNIACRHCGILSSPANKNKMKIDDARRWIVEASGIDGIRKITFTGGEPFLFQDEHADLFSLCKSLGMATRVVTNGFWAKTVDQGLRVLGRMKEAGLTELNFSADIFHLEFMPAETLRNALECARQLGYYRIVSFVTNAEENPLDQFSRLYEVPRSVLMPLEPAYLQALVQNPETERAVKEKILVYAGGLIGLGRAADYPADLRFFPVDRFSVAPCAEVVNKPVIYPDGDLQACCCAGGKIAAFTVGNLHQHNLKALIDDMLARSHFQFINLHGPRALYDAVSEVRSDLPKADRYTSICEVCVRATDGLSPVEMDEIANYAALKRMFSFPNQSAAPTPITAEGAPPAPVTQG